jgi:hypothetical protein
VTDYAAGRRLYLDDQPLDACRSETERLGWLDAQEGIRRSAEEVDDRWEDA